MHRRWSPWTLIFCACLGAGTLTAQEAPRKALVLGLRGPGIYLPISNSAALRAEAAVSYSSSGNFSNWAEGVALSGVFYLSTFDALRTYWGPRIGFTYSAPGGAHSQVASGSVYYGAEYSLSRRFGVFGEAGVTYARTTGTRLGPSGEQIPIEPGNSTSTFSGVGLLLHF